MIRINLLPHREARRKQKKQAFFAMLALGGVVGIGIVLLVGGYNARAISIQEERNQVLKTAIVGVGVVLLVGGYNARVISIQNERNQVIKTAISGLDTKIAEIATLKQEIEALKARFHLWLPVRTPILPFPSPSPKLSGTSSLA